MSIDPMIALGAALFGYLCGSISFARIVTRLVAPDIDIGEGVEYTVPGTDETGRLEHIAGTAVATRLGDKYGGITALGDVLKALLPTLAVYLVFRGMPYYLITAALAIVGHNWPLYYRFKGGAGLSAITGGFLVAAPLGLIVTSVVSTVLGFLVIKGNFGIFLGYSGWIILMVPWIWFTSHDLYKVLYAVVAIALFTIATLPNIRDMAQRNRSGAPDIEFDDMLESIPHGRHLLRLQEKLGQKRKTGEGQGQ